jgi:hypothetical protein
VLDAEPGFALAVSADGWPERGGASCGTGHGAGRGVRVEVVEREATGDGPLQYRRFDQQTVSGRGEVLPQASGGVSGVGKDVKGTPLTFEEFGDDGGLVVLGSRGRPQGV